MSRLVFDLRESFLLKGMKRASSQELEDPWEKDKHKQRKTELETSHIITKSDTRCYFQEVQDKLWRKAKKKYIDNKCPDCLFEGKKESNIKKHHFSTHQNIKLPGIF